MPAHLDYPTATLWCRNDRGGTRGRFFMSELDLSNQHERRRAAALERRGMDTTATATPLNRVRSYPETAEIAGISLATFRRPGAADLLAVDALSAGGLQLFDLAGEVLVLGADPGVSDDGHWPLLF